MSKFFYKGKIEKKPKHESYGFNTSRKLKAGTAEAPLTLVVKDEEELAQVQAQLAEHQLVADISVSEDGSTNLQELEHLLAKPKTVSVEATPNRNDPCSCGSGKKYKKCCG